MKSIPIWEKLTISVEEAVEYTGIGERKLRELISAEGCPFVLKIGRDGKGGRKLIKRKQFEEWLQKTEAI